MFPADIVAQQRRGLIQVDNQHVHIAIIVEVAKGTSATAARVCHAGTSRLNQFFERVIAEITKHGAWRLVRILWQLSFYLWVQDAGNKKQIWMVVVIALHNSNYTANV